MEINQIVIGTQVLYWDVIDDKGNKEFPTLTEITSQAFELGSGEIVCKIKGRTGGFSIAHLEAVSPGSLMAAKLQGLLVSEDYFNKQTVDFFGDRGVRCTIVDNDGQVIMDNNDKIKRTRYFQSIDKQIEVKNAELDLPYLNRAEKGAIRLIIKYMETLQDFGKEVQNG